MRTVLLALCLATAACTGPPPGLPLCTPLPVWTDAQQDALTAEMNAQDGPISHRVLYELEQARAIDRSCLQARD